MEALCPGAYQGLGLGTFQNVPGAIVQQTGRRWGLQAGHAWEVLSDGVEMRSWRKMGQLNGCKNARLYVFPLLCNEFIRAGE